MYPRSFLCEEAKIKEQTPAKKELREIDEEGIWESRLHAFFSKHLCIFLQLSYNFEILVFGFFQGYSYVTGCLVT